MALVPRLSITQWGISLFVNLVFLTLPASSKSLKNDALNNINYNNNNSSSSFFWRINSIPPSYMFGTIHVPYIRVWDAVPSNAKRAFSQANQIYFELDLTDHSTITALSYCQLLPPDQQISTLIPSDLYLRIQIHLDYVRKAMPGWLSQDQKDRGLESDYLFSTVTANWERKRPIWVMMMINSLTKSDVASRGVPVLDLLMSTLAKRQGKEVNAIEKVQEQCKPLNSLNHELVIFALNQTLHYHETLRLGKSVVPFSSAGQAITTDDLIEQYREGNFDSSYFTQDTFQIPTFQTLGREWSAAEVKKSRDIDSYFQKNLIELRNKRMAARVIDLLVNKPDNYFFAFGAGHFVGKNSILEFVEAAGFSVDHISPSESIQFRSDNSNRRNRIKGTFDDLSEDEKTKALLQFIQYQQQLESSEEHNKKDSDNQDNKKVILSSDNSMTDEKAIEESLKVWYGLNENANHSPRLFQFCPLNLILCLSFSFFLCWFT